MINLHGLFGDSVGEAIGIFADASMGAKEHSGPTRINALSQKEVVRYRDTHPYSYEPTEIWHTGDTITHEIRHMDLWRKDNDKYNAAMKSITGDHRQYNIEFSPEQLTQFLQHYFGNNNLEAVQLIEGCETSNGYAYYIFRWIDKSAPETQQRKVWVDENSFGANVERYFTHK